MVGEFVPLAKLTKLERVLSSVKYFSISSSIGEPLLHPELQQILQWLYRINPKISIRATTNGTALTAEKAAWFAGHLDWLSVSLNASNGEAHMRDMFPHLAKRGIDAGKEMGAAPSSPRGVHCRAALRRSPARQVQHDRAPAQHQGYRGLRSRRPKGGRFTRDDHEYPGASEHRRLIFVWGQRPL